MKVLCFGAVFSEEMSTERLSFALNSLIPETYKNKAEAFAKCLQHKLLSLGRIDTSQEPLNGEPRRLNIDNHPGCDDGPDKPTTDAEAPARKTKDSEDELCSHSESENGSFEWGTRKQKLTSMSSEDSTVDSWSSCQENLTDVEKLDSETEEVSSLAAQIKGSPKLRSFNIRAKRKELREKTWKKNPRRNHSSSTESVDSEGVRQGFTCPADDFDREFSSQCILLDGLDPEDDVPHRILRESSSTSSLERHFSCHQADTSFRSKKTDEQASSVDAQMLTPPPSPDIQNKSQQLHHPLEDTKPDDLSSRIHFAQIDTDHEEVHFAEVESLKTPNIDDLFRPVKKMAGVIVECKSDDPDCDFQVPQCSFQDFVITCVEVLQDTKHTDESPTETLPGDVSRDQPDIDVAEDDDILHSRSKMRRCSSLKTWKTPPGTPGSKKIVRFADALGLDLADVRTFLDEIPRVPSSAYEDLHFDLPKCDNLPPPPSSMSTTLLPLFRQPGVQLDFLDKVHNQKICLESTVVTLEGVPTVTGFVRVQNVGFHKSVHVRYTLNNWESFSDLQATYVPNSCNGFSDRFSFALYGHTLRIGEKLEFALRLECSGAQYWDNNGGSNYAFHCLPQSSGSGYFSSMCSSQADPWFDFY